MPAVPPQGTTKTAGDPQIAKVLRACELIERDELVSLDDLAAKLGVSHIIFRGVLRK